MMAVVILVNINNQLFPNLSDGGRVEWILKLYFFGYIIKQTEGIFNHYLIIGCQKMRTEKIFQSMKSYITEYGSLLHPDLASH